MANFLQDKFHRSVNFIVKRYLSALYCTCTSIYMAITSTD